MSRRRKDTEQGVLPLDAAAGEGMLPSADPYLAFLRSKEIEAPRRGLAEVPALSGHLRPFTRTVVSFLLQVGSGGIFLDTGLHKTNAQLEWATHAAAASNGRAIVYTPLGVARQFEAEAKRWGYDARVIRCQDDAREGINIINYDRHHLIDPHAFGAVALDESDIICNFTGKTRRELTEAYRHHRWRASSTATPAPNDHMELGQHAEFCGVMAANEMLARWFTSDQTEMGRYRLKNHGVTAFWDWMASWCRMAEMPSDLGDSDDGFVLPPLRIERHRAARVELQGAAGDIFGGMTVSATGMHAVKRQTAEERARVAADLVTAEPGESWVLWCDTNYEADAVLAALKGTPGVAEVRGALPVERKEALLAAFADGMVRVLVSKPSITGHGLNWQHCARTAYVGRSFSYKEWYQSVRRFWRFGQQREVACHIVVAEGEDAIGRVIDRKAGEHAAMKAAMRSAMARATGREAIVKVPYNPQHLGRIPAWLRSAA